MAREHKELSRNLSVKHKIFGAFLIMVSIGLVYYGISLGFQTNLSGRFILAGIFILTLAIAVFVNKVNTKLMRIALVTYFLIDTLLVGISSKSISINLITELAILVAAIYFVFFRKR
jgi:hypothetical protein